MEARHAPNLGSLNVRIVRCRKCPRLVRFRERIAREKVLRFQDWTYWGRPVPGFGDPDARLLVVGLAPAAHGGNRTGRVFTGDRSGDWLYRALWKAGFADRPVSIAKDDGLKLRDCYISAAVRCAPPANRPTRAEFQNCRPYLERELELLLRLRVVVALGAVAWNACLRALEEIGRELPMPKPKFRHGAHVELDRVVLLGCYHPSPRNTQTGRLGAEMFDDVFRNARGLVPEPVKRVVSG